MEIEIGRGKRGRRGYGLDDIAIVPSRRTRDPEDVDLSWQLGPFRFEIPLLASAMDGVVSPRTAGIIGRLGGLGVLNLEGIQTRYEEPDAELERIGRQAELQVRRAVEVGPDVLQVLLEVPARERHGRNPMVPRPFPRPQRMAGPLE